MGRGKQKLKSMVVPNKIIGRTISAGVGNARVMTSPMVCRTFYMCIMRRCLFHKVFSLTYV